MTPKLLVVGGGKMGSALLTGLVAAGWAPVADLAVSDNAAFAAIVAQAGAALSK